MKKTALNKLMAIIALIWIILWVVSTWALILYETLYAPQTINTSESWEKIDLSKLLENTWSINFSWITIETNTWLTK